jgi:hypothetical protein
VAADPVGSSNSDAVCLSVCYRLLLLLLQQLSAVFLIILSVHIDCCPKQH